MTTAEMMEQLNNKKAVLENYKTSNPPADPEMIKKLEEEIKQLESTLGSSQTTPRRRRAAFLDECAG
jgi:uncharacterized coiled-coil DUF342 family protein